MALGTWLKNVQEKFISRIPVNQWKTAAGFEDTELPAALAKSFEDLKALEMMAMGRAAASPNSPPILYYYSEYKGKKGDRPHIGYRAELENLLGKVSPGNQPLAELIRSASRWWETFGQMDQLAATTGNTIHREILLWTLAAKANLYVWFLTVLWIDAEPGVNGAIVLTMKPDTLRLCREQFAAYNEFEQKMLARAGTELQRDLHELTARIDLPEGVVTDAEYFPPLEYESYETGFVCDSAMIIGIVGVAIGVLAVLASLRTMIRFWYKSRMSAAEYLKSSSDRLEVYATMKMYDEAATPAEREKAKNRLMPYVGKLKNAAVKCSLDAQRNPEPLDQTLPTFTAQSGMQQTVSETNPL